MAPPLKDKCKYGHPMLADNLYWTNGKRRCRRCHLYTLKLAALSKQPEEKIPRSCKRGHNKTPNGKGRCDICEVTLRRALLNRAHRLLQWDEQFKAGWTFSVPEFVEYERDVTKKKSKHYAEVDPDFVAWLKASGREHLIAPALLHKTLPLPEAQKQERRMRRLQNL